MATYYVATTGTGSGVGSQADPFVLSQVDGFGVFGDVIFFAPGTYDTAETVTVARRVSWQASEPDNRPVIRATAPFAGAVLVDRGNESASLESFVLECSSLCGAADFGAAFISRCEFRDVVTSYGARAGKICQTEIHKLDSVQHATVTTQGVESVLVVAPYNGVGRLAFTTSGMTTCSVVAGGITGVSGGSVNVVVIGSQANAFSISAATKAQLKNCIAVNCGSFQLGVSLAGHMFFGCMEFGSSTPAADAPADFISESADPFVDSANLDLRLTEAAKAAPYADRLKAIMARLQDVPGITVDSLADLFGGGGGTTITPFGAGGITG